MILSCLSTLTHTHTNIYARVRLRSADDAMFPDGAFQNLDGPGSYLEMGVAQEPHYPPQRQNLVSNDLMVEKSWLKGALANADKEGGQSIFSVVAAALEKHRVATGLEDLRLEVKTLRQKNMNLRMQLEEMEKMMDANIEDRERTILQRRDQILELKREKEDVSECASRSRETSPSWSCI